MASLILLHMAKKPKPAKAAQDQTKHRRSLGEAIHDHLVAAEVAAEEAAGYGWVTEAVEAAEAAVDPAHELGKEERAPAPEKPRTDKEEKAGT
jgi:hypothetical protein